MDDGEAVDKNWLGTKEYTAETCSTAETEVVVMAVEAEVEACNVDENSCDFDDLMADNEKDNKMNYDISLEADDCNVLVDRTNDEIDEMVEDSKMVAESGDK